MNLYYTYVNVILLTRVVATNSDKNLQLLPYFTSEVKVDLDKYKASYEELEKIQKTKNLDYYAYPAKYYVKPFKIVGNLYYIGDEKVCSHLIDTKDGLIMFDSGFPGSTHLMIQAIWELGFNPKDVKILIHSHEHFDHIGAACEFKALYGTSLAISKAGSDVMKNIPEQVFMEASPNPYSPIFEADMELEDGQIIKLGNTEIECVLTPGHSEGVMSFFFKVQEDDKEYNVGYFGGAGFNTLYKQALINSNRSLSCRETFIESLEKIKDKEVDIVLGNHPKQNNTLEKMELLKTNSSKNPFIDSKEWNEFCITLIDKLKEFIANGN